MYEHKARNQIGNVNQKLFAKPQTPSQYQQAKRDCSITVIK